MKIEYSDKYDTDMLVITRADWPDGDESWAEAMKDAGINPHPSGVNDFNEAAVRVSVFQVAMAWAAEIRRMPHRKPEFQEETP